MPYVRRGRVRKYSRKRGRNIRTKKSGYNKITLPRSFPASELHQPFVSTQSVLLAGHINDASHFQFFRFGQPNDGSSDFGFTAETAGDGNGVGARLVTHSFRNFDLLSPFYDRATHNGSWVTLDFTQQIAADSILNHNYNCYLWMQCNDTNALDNTQPLTLASSGNTASVAADLDTVANTDATIQALEMSRRVQKFRSYREGSTVKLRVRFFLPNRSNRRGYAMNVNRKSRIAGDGGNGSASSQVVGSLLGGTIGFDNQVNCVVVPEFATAATTVVASFFTHLRVTRSFKALFFERNETAN